MLAASMTSPRLLHIAALTCAALVTLSAHDVARLLNPADPEWQRAAPARFTVRFDTSRGIIVIGVGRAAAPLAADRFYNLVRFGYYDDSRFFRVVSGRWAQFGINGDPRISRVWRSRTMRDDPRVESNVRGSVAFAWAEKHGRATQVFINLRDNSSTLDEQGFAPFGIVTHGMEVVDALYDGYGEESGGGIRGGRQDPLFEGGTEFLIRRFPRLDYIRQAALEGTP
jgi:cyclophilin family peptidyl-prolyl cis-trans isomerase